jgi:hypothetical protein
MQTDLSTLKFADLETLRGRIDERIRDMRETEGPALRERFAKEAAALGLTLEELIGANGKRRGRPRGEEAE